MGVDAEELIVRPFREVVERGNEAIQNAEAGEADDASSVDGSVLADMAKAGRAVVREGERALKRLQPVWDGQVEKYGDAFKDAMLQQDDIERRRRELEDLLYDFEDYTEPRSFDAAKFVELQAATRSFALDVINHTKRLKLESPKRASTAAQLAAIAGGGGSAARGTASPLSTPTTATKSSFPPLPPLPPSMAGIPPLPPMPNLASLPPINVNERRSRASLLKNGGGGATASLPRLASLTSHPHTARPDSMDDGDDQLFEASTPTSSVAPSTAPSSSRASLAHSSLRRANTKSSVATSMSGASTRGGMLFDHAERYQLYDHPEGQGQGQDERGHDDSESVAPGGGKRSTPPPPSIPRTSAWVRSHQQHLQQLQQQQAQTQTPSQRLRARASRDTVATDYSYDGPLMLSRFNSLTVDGSVRSASATTSATSATTAPSPVLDSAARSSYLSSAPTSYTSSPILALGEADGSDGAGMNNMNNKPTSSGPAPFVAPPIAALPPPALSAAHGHGSSQSIQDFIKFAPSPPVPPISLPLSPKHLPRRGRGDVDDDVDAIDDDDDHDVHGGGDDGGGDDPLMRDAELDDLEEQIYQRPGSRQQPFRHDRHDRINTKRTMQPDVRDATTAAGDRPMSRQTTRRSSIATQPQTQPHSRPPATPETILDHDLHDLPSPSGMASPNLPPSIPSGMSDKVFDNGLMVVDEEKDKDKAKAGAASAAGDNADVPLTREFVREADCSIGPKSTFEMMGGFCKGADLYRSGGHWQGIKQTGGYVANKQASIGRCVGCSYAHNYEEVRLDMEKKPEATFTKAGGARFRLRLLYKSHIATAISSQRQAESHYACIFCVHAGATVREGDATVFTTPDHLLLHLARHPQPLPLVPGVTVLYGTDYQPASASSVSTASSSDPDTNNFDLHLVNPPLPTPVPPSVGQAPVATATREHLQRWGAKKLARPPNYGGDMLHFLAGARVVGVMFPEKWEGKWCMGWHDGFVGAFPAKAALMEPPRPSEIPMASSDSGMSVTTRWKWKPHEEKDKDKDGKKQKGSGDSSSSVLNAGGEASLWLSFDKGETISNVKCLYADHWCWAGTNSKGRFGVFPQSHILTKTLQQESLAPLRPIKTGGWSAKSIFKGGSSGGRRPPSSSAASSMSNSTGRTRYT
ncbi:uncharacterized protein SPSK_08383 [Sporothrix schenckii 1099-18]|uniref:Sh3 domain containing protein n=1 Tax=Sporothrix schenckii 1099-18 TaxID=1397361 RepID=A0A0F2M697_SPOSC|nr:uncharacterized protein SPSK_08383 [Sporothrix schenckii 1099-18]KJR84325.1 hypothetical protein SPSK_08383 [Sporothrix schenckii 1099-18]